MEQLTLEALQYYEQNPCDYAQDVIGFIPDRWQRDAFKHLVSDHYVAIRSGSGVGKSAFMAIALLWFISTKPFCKVPTTAPSQHQLYDILWSECYKWIKSCPYLSKILRWTQTRIGMIGYEPSWYAVARTAAVSPGGDVSEGLQGFHCFSHDTDILTDNGWKNISDLDIKTDKVLSMDPNTMVADYYEASEFIEEDYDGSMYTIHHQNHDFCVTPNHKMLYRVRSHGKLSQWKTDEIEDIPYVHWYIGNTFKWRGFNFESFPIPSFKGKVKYYPEKYVNGELWFYFLGLYLAEGWCNERTVSLSQKGDAIAEFSVLIQLLGFNTCLSIDTSGYDCNVVNVHSPQLCNHLKDFGDRAVNKKVPQYVKVSSPELIRAFLDGYLRGDGYINQKGTKIYYTSSPQLADDLQELIFKAGGKASLRKYSASDNSKKESYIRGYLVVTKHDRYRVAEYVDSAAYLTIRNESLDTISYKGKVYCVNVAPHHLVFTRRNGFCMWSGNSDDNLLFLLDETSGIPDQVFPAVEGSLTGENAYCIVAGNPTRRYGYFYDVFHKPQTGKRYYKMHVSCLDSARVSQGYIEMMKERYGEEHPVYRIKVLGEFPTASDDFLFPPEFIEAMRNNKRESLVSPKMRKEMGVDIGRVRAASVATIRQGYNILLIEEKERKKGSITDTMDLVQWITGLINTFGVDVVRIDANGIGAGVCDVLIKVFGAEMIIPVIGSAQAADSKQYGNLRSEGFWILRSKLPKLYYKSWPERLLVELSYIKTKKAGNSDKSLVESKNEMVDRYLRSFDYVDSLMYSFLTTADGDITKVITNVPINVMLFNEEKAKASVWNHSPSVGWSRFGRAVH